MAKNAVFPYTEKLTEIWPVAAATAPGKAILSATGQPGVALVGSNDYTVSQAVGPYTISGIPRGGASLKDGTVSVATDGTWEFTVTGAASNTAQNALVYITSAGALTLTATDNTVFGKVNYPRDYVFKTGILPVKIGKF